MQHTTPAGKRFLVQDRTNAEDSKKLVLYNIDCEKETGFLYNMNGREETGSLHNMNAKKE